MKKFFNVVMIVALLLNSTFFPKQMFAQEEDTVNGEQEETAEVYYEEQKDVNSVVFEKEYESADDSDDSSEIFQEKEETPTEDDLSTEDELIEAEPYIEAEDPSKPEASSGSCGNNLTYTLSDTGILTIGGTGDMSDFSSTTQPWKDERDRITSVVISNGVTTIGKYAFYNLTNLASVTIPSTVKSIAANAFQKCTSLTDIYIPESVTSIASGVFSGCSYSMLIYLEADSASEDWPVGWKQYATNGAGTPSYLHFGTGFSREEYTYWSSLDKQADAIAVPSYVDSMPYGAFNQFDSVITIDLSNSRIQDIPMYGINGCDLLENIKFPATLKSIDSNNFSLLSNLKNVYIYDLSGWLDVNANSAIGYAYDLYVNDELLTDLVIPYTAEKLRKNLFSNCSSIVSATIPDSVKTIDQNAFENCDLLADVILPDSGITLNPNAFKSCDSLKTFFIPKTAVLSSGVFYGSSSLHLYVESETIPSEWDSKWNVYEVKESGTILRLGYDNGLSYEEYRYWTSLNKDVDRISVPSYISHMPKGAFDGNKTLEEIDLSATKITQLPDRSFYYCTSLNTVKLPSTIQSTLSSNVFSGGTKLSKVYIDDLEAWLNFELKGEIPGSWTLYVNDLPRSAIDIPESVTTIRQYTFANCTGLKNVTLPDSVTSIEQGAFKSTSLDTVFIPASVETITGMPFVGTASSMKIYIETEEVPSAWTKHWNCYYPKTLSDSSISYFDLKVNTGYSFTDYYWETLDKTAVSVMIPERVDSIPAQAFMNNTALQHIILPASLSSIGTDAFKGCSKLQTVDLPYIGKVFEIDYGNEMSNPLYNGATAKIPGEDGKVYIDVYDVTIPSSINAIKPYSLSCWKSLKSVEIGSNIAVLPANSFKNCTSLKNMFVSEDVSISAGAFYNCKNTMGVFIDREKRENDETLFSINSAGTSKVIVNYRSNPEDYFFWSRLSTTLSEIYVPENVYSLADSYFNSNKIVRTINLHDDIDYIDASLSNYLDASCKIVINENSKTEQTLKQAGLDEWIFYSVCNEVHFAEKNILLAIGTEKELQITTLPENTVDSFVFAAEDESIVSIDENTIKAMKAGKTTVTVTSGKGHSDTCEVEVIVPVTSVTVPQQQSIIINQTGRIESSVLPEDATYPQLKWTSSDPEALSVDQEGNITPHLIGTVTVTAESTDGTNISSSCVVEVLPIPVSSLTLDKEELYLPVGNSETLIATVLPEDAGNKNVDWHSMDTSIATVTRQGLVKGISAGTVEIMAATTDGTGIKTGCTVHVVYVHLDKTSLIMNPDEEVSLQPESNDEGDLVYESSDENVVTVDQNGKITSVGYGSAQVRVTSSHGASAVCEVTVKDIAYTITYVLNGGTNSSVNPGSHTWKDEIILSDPSRTAYEFSGWYTDPDFTEKITVIPEGSKGDLTLYAKWTPIVYSITYELDGGENSASNVDSYTIEDTVSLNDAYKDAYDFLGWYKDPEFKNKVTVLKNSYGDLTLYAKWGEKSYKITYILNGGTNNSNNKTSYTISDSFEFLDPYRTAYDFSGWYTDPSFTDRITSISERSKGDLTIYAKWTPISYTITYVLDGGTNDDRNPVSYDTESTAAFYDPYKEDFDFLGWYKEPTFKNKVTSLSGLNGNLTLYAKWSEKVYSITYHDAYVHSNPSSYKVSDKTVILKNASRAAYDFAGWYLDAGLMTKVEAVDCTLRKDIDLYAKWTPISYSITYELNGGVNHPDNFGSFTVEDVLTLYDAVKDGYRFMGWYEDTSFTKPVTIIEKRSGDLKLYAKWEEKVFTVTYHDAYQNENPSSFKITDGTIRLKDAERYGYTFDGWYFDETLNERAYEIDYTIDKDIDLYAKWIANTYKIHFDERGGSEIDDIDVVFDQPYGELPISEKEHYVFSGWFMEEELMNEISPESIVSVAEDHTLYVRWIPVAYRIDYDLDGGTNSALNPETYDIETEVILKDPTKEGFVFVGWYKDDTKIEKIALGSYGDIRLKAVWIDSDDPFYFTNVEQEENGNVIITSSNRNWLKEVYANRSLIHFATGEGSIYPAFLSDSEGYYGFRIDLDDLLNHYVESGESEIFFPKTRSYESFSLPIYDLKACKKAPEGLSVKLDPNQNLVISAKDKEWAETLVPADRADAEHLGVIRLYNEDESFEFYTENKQITNDNGRIVIHSNLLRASEIPDGRYDLEIRIFGYTIAVVKDIEISSLLKELTAPVRISGVSGDLVITCDDSDFLDALTMVQEQYYTGEGDEQELDSTIYGGFVSVRIDEADGYIYNNLRAYMEGDYFESNKLIREGDSVIISNERLKLSSDMYDTDEAIVDLCAHGYRTMSFDNIVIRGVCNMDLPSYSLSNDQNGNLIIDSEDKEWLKALCEGNYYDSYGNFMEGGKIIFEKYNNSNGYYYWAGEIDTSWFDFYRYENGHVVLYADRLIYSGVPTGTYRVALKAKGYSEVATDKTLTFNGTKQFDGDIDADVDSNGDILIYCTGSPNDDYLQNVAKESKFNAEGQRIEAGGSIVIANSTEEKRLYFSNYGTDHQPIEYDSANHLIRISRDQIGSGFSGFCLVSVYSSTYGSYRYDSDDYEIAYAILPFINEAGEPAYVSLGESRQFTCDLDDDDLTWWVDNEELATVDENGILYAKKPGIVHLYMEDEYYDYIDMVEVVLLQKKNVALLLDYQDEYDLSSELRIPEHARYDGDNQIGIEEVDVLYEGVNEGNNYSSMSFPRKEGEYRVTWTIKDNNMMLRGKGSAVFTVFNSSGARYVADVRASEENGSVLEKGTKVYLDCDTPDARIYYVFGNGDPVIDGQLYIDGIEILDSLTLRAIAIKEGYEDSHVSEFAYTVRDDCDYGEIMEEDIPEDGEIPSGIWTSTVADQVYSGKALTPEIRVYFENKLLISGIDYTLKYTNNINAASDQDVKAPTININAKGNFTGTLKKTFNIVPKDISKTEYGDISVLYTGKPIKSKPIIKDGKITLKENKQYTLSYGEGNFTDTGNYRITVNGIGNYCGSIVLYEEILEKGSILVSKLSISLGKAAYGEDPDVTIKNGKNELSKDLFEIEFFGNYVRISAKPGSGYFGTVRKNFTYALGKASVEGLNVSYEYSGTPITPQISLRLDGKVVDPQDYTLTFSNNIKKGKATVKITGINRCSGSLSKTFTINAKPIDLSMVELSNSYEYEKDGVKPLPILRSDGMILKLNTDYTLKYSGSSITITGKGNYSGTLTRSFTVVDKELKKTNFAISDPVYSAKKGNWRATISLKDSNGKVLKAGVDYDKTLRYTYADNVTVKDYSNAKNPVEVQRKLGEVVNVSDCVPAGTLIKVTVKGMGHYKGSHSTTYRVVAASVAKAVIKLNNQIYSGHSICPSKSQINVKVGSVVLRDSDYQIVSYINNVNTGTAKLTIRGVGDYGGVKTQTFKIAPLPVNSTIIYNPNGLVKGTMKNQTFTAGKVQLNKNQFVKNGYTFLGWSTKDNGEIVYRDQEVIDAPKDSLILYAVWSKNVYHVTYSLSQGEVNDSRNVSTYCVDDPNITLYAPKKNGYAFDGWYSGSKKLTMIKNGSTGNLVLTPRWKIATYTITYVTDKDVVNPNKSVTKYTMQKNVTFADASRTGYIFEGWYTNARFTGEKITSSQGHYQNLTLYPKWEPISYMILFKSNGGSGSMTPVFLKYNEEYTVGNCTFGSPSSDRVFAGWMINKKFYVEGSIIKTLSAKDGDVVIAEAVWSLPAPGNIGVSRKAPDWVKLSWTKVDGAFGYCLYKSESEDGPFVLDTIIPGYESSYRDIYVKPGKTYYYKMSSFSEEQMNGFEYGKRSSMVVGETSHKLNMTAKLVHPNNSTIYGIYIANKGVSDITVNVRNVAVCQFDGGNYYDASTNIFGRMYVSFPNDGIMYSTDVFTNINLNLYSDGYALVMLEYDGTSYDIMLYKKGYKILQINGLSPLK